MCLKLQQSDATYNRTLNHPLHADVKKLEQRIDTLKEHIEHSENFKKYRKVKRIYDGLYVKYENAKMKKGFFAERRAQKALDAVNEYREDYRPQLAMFDNAETYLRDVLQGRFDPKKLPPITKWREELAAKPPRRTRSIGNMPLLKMKPRRLKKSSGALR